MKSNSEINIRVSSNLLDNSLDLFLDGVESIKKRRSGKSFSLLPELKSSLLAITIGVELLVKAKIASVEWKQIFKNPSKANISKIIDGTLMSINFEKCLSRIENISSIRFDLKSKNDIEQIRIIRNKIAHYHHKPNDGEILSLIVNAIGFYLRFYQEQIFDSFCEEEDRTKYVDRDLKDVKQYVKLRVKAIKELIKDKQKPITRYFCECPECLQDVYVLKDNMTAVCSFCKYEEDIKEVAITHSEIKDVVKYCPKCSCESMHSFHDDKIEEEAWQCIVCGFYINRPYTWRLGNREKTRDSIRDEFRHLQ